MQEKMKLYAKFLLKRCLCMNKGEPLVVAYSTNQTYFFEIVKKTANELGISEVYEICFDGKKTRKILLNSTIDEINNDPYFDRSILKKVYDKGGSYLDLYSFEPSALEGVPEEKKTAMNKVKVETQKDAAAARMTYKFPWCIAAVATKAWADELFPNEQGNLDKLWNIIFKCTLMDQNDPAKAWEEKIRSNNERKNMLSELKLQKLIYQNSLGTNLEVCLPKDVIWWGAAKKSYDGKKNLIVNMPTEEVFTTPDRNKINGVVVSSKPLVIRGTVIDRFKLTFKDGKITSVESGDNKAVLECVIKEYDGMDYLGECALVDYHSPISMTNIIFKSILLDENASCHLALGKGFPQLIPGGNELSHDELLSNGINQSKNHVDFMIGTDDLSIIGIDIYDNEVPIFIDGDFATEQVKKFLKERKDRNE